MNGLTLRTLTSLVLLVDDKVDRCLGNQRFDGLWQGESARKGEPQITQKTQMKPESMIFPSLSSSGYWPLPIRLERDLSRRFVRTRWLMVIAHPSPGTGLVGSFVASTKRRTSSTEARLAFAVLTRERKAA